MSKMSKKGNIAKTKPINEKHSRNIARSEMLKQGFHSDFQQVLKRISPIPTGLRNGSPPGPVT